MSKKNKKSNNIGTGMHTVAYLGQQYIKSDYKKPLTLQEIVEDQTKHTMLIPRSKEDYDYVNKLEGLIVKDIPEEVILQKCNAYLNMPSHKEENTLTTTETLNLRCYCHNCDSHFPLRNLKWIDLGEKPEPVLHSDVETLEDLHWNLVDGEYPENAKISEIIKNAINNPNSDIYYPLDDLEFKYYGLQPMCGKFPTCPSPYSKFDLFVNEDQYNENDHKKGKYDY